MTSDPSPRQVLYALVGLGLHLVVAVLIVGAVPLVPRLWTLVASLLWVGVGLVGAMGWRRTGRVLALTIGFFLVWMVVTLAVR